MDHHHHHSHHSMPTPTDLIRKLSHPKILTHLHLINKDEDKEGSQAIIKVPHQNNQDIEAPQEGPPQTGGDIGLQMKPIPRFRSLPGGKYLGLILALFASLTISLMTLIVKTMGARYHAFSLVLWRLQGVLFPSLGFILCHYPLPGGRGEGHNEKKDEKKGFQCSWGIAILLLGRGLFGCGADIFQYCSLQYLSLADSSVIAFSTPIFVAFMAYLVLGEKLGVVPILTGVLSLVGVIIISRPPILTGEEEFDTNILIGNALALGCMFMSTLTFISLRKLSKIHFSLSMFSYGSLGSLESLLLCLLTGTLQFPENLQDWILSGTIAFTCFLGQMFFTFALQLEDAGPVSLVRSCDVIFAYLWQFIFLDVVPDMFSLIGGSIVISGVVITAFRKFLQELPPNDTKKERFWFLLK